MLPCTAKVCTSWIRLKTTAILLGDCNVAERVTRVVEVRNLSQMPARIAVKKSSDYLTFDPMTATIPPKQSHFICPSTRNSAPRSVLASTLNATARPRVTLSPR